MLPTGRAPGLGGPRTPQTPCQSCLGSHRLFRVEVSLQQTQQLPPPRLRCGLHGASHVPGAWSRVRTRGGGARAGGGAWAAFPAPPGGTRWGAGQAAQAGGSGEETPETPTAHRNPLHARGRRLAFHRPRRLRADTTRKQGRRRRRAAGRGRAAAAAGNGGRAGGGRGRKWPAARGQLRVCRQGPAGTGLAGSGGGGGAGFRRGASRGPAGRKQQDGGGEGCGSPRGPGGRGLFPGRPAGDGAGGALETR